MKKLLLSAFSIVALHSFSQTFTNATGGPILDNTTVTFPLVVSGMPPVIDMTYGISSVCFNINHTYDGDLDIKLQSPAGTLVVLSNNNGGSGQNYTGTCLAENGISALAAAIAPFTGTFIPDNSINAFNNSQDPNGIWTIIIADEAPVDVGTLLNFDITFSASPPSDPPPASLPCSDTNPGGCACPDSTSINCDLLPDMIASADIIQQQNTEYTGYMTLSNATPNIGWGPMEIHPSSYCWCDDTIPVLCTTTICPSGNPVEQQLTQRIYHKNDTVMTFYDTLTPGRMSYHPSHGHVHVNNWAVFSLRTSTSNPDATTWPIVAQGQKISFCLINLGNCTADYGFCRDSLGNVLTMAAIPNAPFGLVSGCGLDQGIYTGMLDIYDQGLAGMDINLSGVCNGNYYIVSITDPNNDFIESKEWNNWAAAPITLTMQGTPPNANFTYTYSGMTVNFNNTTTMGGVGMNPAYNWNFGNGFYSTNLNPSFTYSTPGTYTVTLTVTNNCGTDSISFVLNVTGIEVTTAPVQDFSAFPNPSNDFTTVAYTLNEDAQVVMELYNSIGERITTVMNEKQTGGEHTQNINLKKLGLKTGVYTIRLMSDNRSFTRPVMFIE